MNLIDIGANLTHESFAADLPDVLARARAHGVSEIVITGADREGNHRAQTLVTTPGMPLYATAGNHPHYASEFDDDLHQQILNLATNGKIAAVGEAGLDYFRDLSPRADQTRCFEAQLQVAADTGLPIFMHQREAHEDFFAIMKAWRDKLSAAVVHCFTDTAAALDDYLSLDLHIGITGWICDERRGTHLREIVGRIPANRLMIETDSPYLLPRDIRPKPKSRRNEPMHLAHICETVAQCRGEAVEITAEQTAQTARHFFRLPS